MKKLMLAIFSAMLLVMALNITKTDSFAKTDYNYTINVNRSQQIMTITRINSAGKTVTVKTFACSTGVYGGTPVGTYKISSKFEWKKMIHDVWARYACLFSSQGQGLLIHSVPYYIQDKSRIEYKEYNKLGRAASAGCIRLSVADAKWVYENCKSGTAVRVYDDPKEKLGIPIKFTIPTDHPNRGWDPSATFDADNPWLVTMYTTQECSVWSEPFTHDKYREKKLPAGYPVRVSAITCNSTRGDGKVFYKTVKGKYILATCLSTKPIKN